jgi:hypothetical protein
MKVLFYFSKALYVVFLIYFLTIEVNEQGCLVVLDIPYVLVFCLLTATLVLISFLACFAPIKRPYDLSIVFPELPPLKKGFFTKPRLKRCILILENGANIAIYIFMLYYVIEPTPENIIYLGYSFIPLACFYLVSAFTPETVKQDLLKIFPELK